MSTCDKNRYGDKFHKNLSAETYDNIWCYENFEVIHQINDFTQYRSFQNCFCTSNTVISKLLIIYGQFRIR